MKKVIKFKTYDEFTETREASEGKFPIIESYCDIEAGIFILTLITMSKDEKEG